MARAHRWKRMLESGEFGSITELAAAEKIDRFYLCRVLRLTLLAPEFVEAILDGRQPGGVTLPGLMKGIPVEWEGQEIHVVRCSREHLPSRYTPREWHVVIDPDASYSSPAKRRIR